MSSSPVAGKRLCGMWLRSSSSALPELFRPRDWVGIIAGCWFILGGISIWLGYLVFSTYVLRRLPCRFCRVDPLHFFTGLSNYCEALYILAWQERHVSNAIEALTGIPILTASSTTGLMLCFWFLGPEKRVASTRRFVRKLLDSPMPTKSGFCKMWFCDPRWRCQTPPVQWRLVFDLWFLGH